MNVTYLIKHNILICSIRTADLYFHSNASILLMYVAVMGLKILWVFREEKPNLDDYIQEVFSGTVVQYLGASQTLF